MTRQHEESCAEYVRAAAALMDMPLHSQREVAVTAVFARLAAFAADVRSYSLGDDVEIAGPAAVESDDRH